MLSTAFECIRGIPAGAVTFGKRDVVTVPAWGQRMEPYFAAPRNHEYRHVGLPSSAKAARAARRRARMLMEELGIMSPNEVPEVQDSRDDTGEAVAAPAKAWCGPRRWLVDTGSAFDLVSEKDVPSWYKSQVVPSDVAIELSTANGRALVDTKVPMQIGPLHEDVEPLVLPNTPPVISVGRRCVEGGCSFHWPAGKTPYLVDPKGRKHYLEVQDYVPYLLDGPKELAAREADPAFPAPAPTSKAVGGEGRGGDEV